MSIPIAMGCRNYQLHSAGVTNIVKLVPMLVQITKSHPIHIRNDDCKKRKKVCPHHPCQPALLYLACHSFPSQATVLQCIYVSAA